MQLLQERNGSRLHQIILREVHRLNRLVEDFLTSSKPLSLTLAPAQPAAIIAEILTAFENDPRCQGKSVHHTFQAEPTLMLDSARFHQVIWNLLINAAHATGVGGNITITVRQGEDEEVEIAVSDDGIGISPEKLLRIFDPFYTTRTGGTGLGLANVDRIIRAHGGTVAVESTEGEGTTFFVRLPRHPKAEG